MPIFNSNYLTIKCAKCAKTDGKETIRRRRLYQIRCEKKVRNTLFYNFPNINVTKRRFGYSHLVYFIHMHAVRFFYSALPFNHFTAISPLSKAADQKLQKISPLPGGLFFRNSEDLSLRRYPGQCRYRRRRIRQRPRRPTCPGTHTRRSRQKLPLFAHFPPGLWSELFRQL